MSWNRGEIVKLDFNYPCRPCVGRNKDQIPKNLDIKKYPFSSPARGTRAGEERGVLRTELIGGRIFSSDDTRSSGGGN